MNTHSANDHNLDVTHLGVCTKCGGTKIIYGVSAYNVSTQSSGEGMAEALRKLISYYYNELGNGAGGYLHVVLDDGNISHSLIYWCREQAEENKDSFCVYLCDEMMKFSEDELNKIYEDNWWGMR